MRRRELEHDMYLSPLGGPAAVCVWHAAGGAVGAGSPQLYQAPSVWALEHQTECLVVI
jgi:hypothetical protein